MRERFESAAEILALHADGLRLRFGLQRLLDAHIPLLIEHVLGHAVRERRPRHQTARQARRLRQQLIGRDQLIEEAPALALFRRHGATGKHQLGGPALTDQPRQNGARAHVTTGQADAGEQKCGLRRGCADPKIRHHRDDRAGPRTDAVHRRDHHLRTAANRLDQITRHARERQQLRHGHARQRTDDVVHVAAGREVATGTVDHDGT